VNIICLYWKGNFRGRDFSPRDVDRLKRTVDKWIDRPYDFYVLTNCPTSFDGMKTISLKHNWPGWWSKVELHRPSLIEGRTLYLDLDSHVVSNLGPILDYPGNLVMFNTRFYRVRKNEECWKIVTRYQAAVMLFDPGSTSFIYDRFLKDPEYYMLKYRSDQDLMGEWIPKQPTFPNKWLMKMGQLKQRRNLKETIIVTGQPKTMNFRKVDWLERIAR